MATQAELIAGMERWLPDDIDMPDVTKRRDISVTSALRRFGKDVPRRVSQEVTTNPLNTGTLTVAWDREFSEVLLVEWPYLTKTNGILTKTLQKYPNGLPRVTQDVEPSGDYFIRFPGVAVSVGSPALLTYTAQWTADVLPVVWEDAVTVLASALLCNAIAGVYDGAAMPEPGGVAILDAGEKADNYRENHQILMAMYHELVGMAPSKTPPVASLKERKKAMESSA